MVNEHVKYVSVVMCMLIVSFAGTLTGCASLPAKETVLATVDGDPITEDDLAYRLNIAHRREDLDEGGSLDISGYIWELIDDRLIIIEARKTGIEQRPGIQEKLHAWIVRESVVRLHNDEIIQKISVSQNEVRDSYRENYSRYHIILIETGSEQEAAELLARIKDGEDMGELARQYSMHQSKETGGEISYRRDAIARSPEFEKVLVPMEQGDVSDVVSINEKYYVIKLLEMEEAPEEDFDAVKKTLRQSLMKEKQTEREAEVLKQLREKADITIDRELLASIDVDDEEKMQAWSGDTRPLATVYGSVYTVSDLIASAKPSRKATPETFSSEAIIDRWIDIKLVDHEALGRKYENEPEIRKALNRYRDILIRDEFIRTVIAQNIKMSKKDIQEYYKNHPEDFMKPTTYTIQWIVVKTEDEAKDVLKILRSGADFNWVASQRSIKPPPKGRGAAQWKTKSQLPEYMQDRIDTMKPGDLSPVIQIGDSRYVIVQLTAKRDAEVKSFDMVKDRATQEAFSDKVRDLLDSYVAQLKEDAEIEINDDVIQSLSEKFEKKDNKSLE